jgi:CHAD domain-containing protein
MAQTQVEWGLVHDRDAGADPLSHRRPHRLAGLVDDYLQEQFAAFADEAARTRDGENRVHKFRVSIRRTRSTVRVFGDLFDADAAAVFDAELRWFADLLGRARDLDVVRERLEGRVAELPAEMLLGPVAADIASLLAHDRAAAGRAVDEAMGSRRYLGLTAQVDLWRTAPPRSELDPKASAVARYVHRAGRTVEKRLQAAIASGVDDDFHRARKAAKRHRYAAELALPRLGDEAARVVVAAEALQEELGALQDAAAARAVLVGLGRRLGPEAERNAFAYGLMYGLEVQAADDVRRGIAAARG